MNNSYRLNILKSLKKTVINSWVEVFNIENINQLAVVYKKSLKTIKNNIKFKKKMEPVTALDNVINKKLIAGINFFLPLSNIISEEEKKL